ncbi:hypothetical protein TNCV_1905481 [Trichonephila clavipes]|nr:hypothetical protein TNCV_1905481 [Trichonephila clavipes]
MIEPLPLKLIELTPKNENERSLQGKLTDDYLLVTKTKIRFNGCQRNKSLIPKFAEKKYQGESISEYTPQQGEAGGRNRPNENETEVRHEGEEWKSARKGGLTAPKRVRGAPKTQWKWKMLLDFFFAAGVKNGRSLQGKLADGTVVEVEEASFYTDPISDVRQMHMNVVKCSN